MYHIQSPHMMPARMFETLTLLSGVSAAMREQDGQRQARLQTTLKAVRGLLFWVTP